MEDVERFKPRLSCSQDAHHLSPSEPLDAHPQMPDPDHQLIKTQIANHPLYPNLLSAYIQCRKVGAPPQLSSLLEEISRQNHPTIPIGDDPELDHFMESYCQVLHKYKDELWRPFNEATLFLTNIQSQLSNLCKGSFTNSSHYPSDEAGMSSGEELSCEEVEGGGGSSSNNKEIKEMLLRKYSGYLSNLRKEFLKTRKKGKLPKDARTELLNWWNTHYRWPYPTEEEKVKLSEVSGLNQKQINNWFINQRKRHWKPSEDMRFGIMGVSAGSVYFDSLPPPPPPPPPPPQSHHS